MVAYPTRRLGSNGPEVSALGFGTMGLGEIYGKEDVTDYNDLLGHSIDRGMTYWDCADIYGTAENKIGTFFEKFPERRKEVFLATKFGAYQIGGDPTKGPFSDPAYIHERIAISLKQMHTDYIDLYYQHRVDPKVPIEVVLDTLEPYVKKGTIKWIGLSEANLDTVTRARNHPTVGEKVVAVQMEYSPFTLDIEKNGLAAGCDKLGVSIVAYSPLARGLVSGRFRSRDDFKEGDLRLKLPRWSEENFGKNLVLVDKIIEIAKRSNATAAQITLAWILAEHPTWFAIPGCRDASRLDENAKGAEITLSKEDEAELRQLAENAEIAGTRNVTAAWVLAGVEGKCIPVNEWTGSRPAL